jgi:Fic-DOC domain mobile mystery protein B
MPVAPSEPAGGSARVSRRPAFLHEPESPGNTPLDPDEAEGLLPAHIIKRAELNEWEQANILKGQDWAFRRRRRVLSLRFAQELHRRMFGDTWVWAGSFRRSDKNIGVHWPTIPQAVQDTLSNAEHWLENETYDVDEAAARFHHRLVWVHPFPNGNGRHARLMTDLLLWNLGREPFTWGRESLIGPGAARDRYLEALHHADHGNMVPLMAFVRS